MKWKRKKSAHRAYKGFKQARVRENPGTDKEEYPWELVTRDELGHWSKPYPSKTREAAQIVGEERIQ